jgi:type IV pilus assembly protein PilO
MEQLLDKVMKAPLAVKAGVIAGLLIIITILNFFLMVQPTEDAITAQETKLRDANRTLAEKKDYAQNLNDKRKELVEYEQRLQEALTQLPEQKDVDELLAQLNDIGKKSGLEIASVTPGGEVPSGTFLSRIPVRMTVTGNYHEIAMFLQEVSSMRRIVNVNNITLDVSSNKNEKILLKSDFVATAFRFVEQKAGAVDGKKKGAKKGAK